MLERPTGHWGLSPEHLKVKGGKVSKPRNQRICEKPVSNGARKDQIAQCGPKKLL
jgi:hypothetical protein